jgi:hypothetical protein
MAENAAGYVLIAPYEHRAATASVAEGFRDACTDHGIYRSTPGTWPILGEGRHGQSRRDDTSPGRAWPQGEERAQSSRADLPI